MRPVLPLVALALVACDSTLEPKSGPLDCPDQSTVLLGEWITEGANTSSPQFLVHEFRDDRIMSSTSVSGGKTKQSEAPWWVGSFGIGTCDRLEIGTSSHFRIYELTNSRLSIALVEGSYEHPSYAFTRLSGGEDVPTCEQPCDPGNPLACAEGEVCLNAAIGWVCLPPDCQTCWNQSLSCNYYLDGCVYQSCS